MAKKKSGRRASKVRKMFCEKCGKKTEHTTPFFGMEFQCVNDHYPKDCCQTCGKKLRGKERKLLKVAVILGAQIHCAKCAKARCLPKLMLR